MLGSWEMVSVSLIEYGLCKEIIMFKTKYRIKGHGLTGVWWSVQFKVWWWPFWITTKNYFDTPEQAKAIIRIISVEY